jgi:protein TonB
MGNAFLKYGLLSFLLLYAGISFSQQDKKDIPREVFTTAEQMPSFPGGKNALNKYIQKHLRYPEKSMKHAAQGKVVLRFIVEPDGSITHAEVLRGMDSECDKVALKAIQEMPKWDPGMQHGVFVAVYYTLPITFAMH